MNPQRPIAEANSADLRGSWPALRRAAERARQLAAQTGTAVVVVRNGVVQHLYPTGPQPSVSVAKEPSPSHVRPS